MPSQKPKISPVKIAIVVWALLIAVILAVWLITSRRSAAIDLLIAPASAEVQINGRSFNNGTHRVEPGRYDIFVSKDGFVSYSASFMVREGETFAVHQFLMQTDGTYQWYIDHPDDGMLLTSIGSSQADESSQGFMERYPILNVIPYTDASPTGIRFNIATRYTPVGELVVLVNLNTCSKNAALGYKNAALDWLRSVDINPSDYNLEYSTICGPLEP
jgi:hypothetical protein